MNKTLVKIDALCENIKIKIANNDIENIEASVTELLTLVEHELTVFNEHERIENKDAIIKIQRSLHVIEMTVTNLKEINTAALKSLTNNNLTYDRPD